MILVNSLQVTNTLSEKKMLKHYKIVITKQYLAMQQYVNVYSVGLDQRTNKYVLTDVNKFTGFEADELSDIFKFLEDEGAVDGFIANILPVS